MSHASDDDDLGIDSDPAPRPFMAEFRGVAIGVRRRAPAARQRRFPAHRTRGAQVPVAADDGGWRHEAGGRFRDRRVAVTNRLMRFDPVAGAAVTDTTSFRHLRYLERDGVARDGGPGRAYSAIEDAADGRAFLARGRDDRSQFRIVVAADDGAALGDLRPATRELMRRVAADLGTALDWIAVDHFDTGRPHTHILVRGAAGGRRLYIASDYLNYGIRQRACELVTEILGRESEVEAAARLAADAGAERLTGLDRALIEEQRRRGAIDLRPGQRPHGPGRDDPQAVLVRLRRLERYGLAEETEPLRYLLAPETGATLVAMGARSDAVEAVHRALQAHGLAGERDLERYVIHGAGTPSQQFEGRVIAKDVVDEDLAGEGGARIRLVVDGSDGRVHHLEVAAVAAVARVRRGMIVALAPADRGGPGVRILSTLDLAQQVDSGGPTWLDRELVARGRIPAGGSGFGAETAAALARRAERLAERGHARGRPDGSWLVPRDLLAVLTREDVERAAGEIARARGCTFVPLRPGSPVAGVLEGPATLAGGRWAVIDDGVSLSLAPWHDALGRRVGRWVTGIAGDGGVEWSFARTRGIER